MRFPRSARLAAVLTASLAASAMAMFSPASAQANHNFLISHTANGELSRLEDMRPLGDATLGAAIESWGTPKTYWEQPNNPYNCSITWRSNGVTIVGRFGDVGQQGNPNPCFDTAESNMWQAIVGGWVWRTKAGLRVGDTRARMLALYPDAAKDGYQRYTLLWYTQGQLRLPSLQAHVVDGVVTKFTVHRSLAFG